MRIEEEQSKVPCVLRRRIVGTPDLATECVGLNPPFARSSMICLPSIMVTLFTICSSGLASLLPEFPFPVNIIAPPIMIAVAIIAIIILLLLYVFGFASVILEVKYWRDYS